MQLVVIRCKKLIILNIKGFNNAVEQSDSGKVMKVYYFVVHK